MVVPLRLVRAGQGELLRRVISGIAGISKRGQYLPSGL